MAGNKNWLPGLAAIVLAVWFVPTPAEAGIYKCVGADGSIGYSQTPCPTETETAKVIASTSSKNAGADCRVANNFARKTAMDMRNGMSSGDVFAAYGGIDALPRTSIGVINYVYTHKGNVDTGPQRIAALSAARCSAGSYGPVGCDDFPYGFISELGGCEAAAKSSMTAATFQTGGENTNNNQQQTASGSQPEPQSLGIKTSSGQDATTSSGDCRKSVQSQLNDLFEQMRSGQSASQLDSMNSKQNDLKKQLSSC